MQGTVVYYNEEKGYGFIDSPEYEDNVFIHHSKINNTSGLSQGQKVVFQVTKTSKGFSAINLEAGEKQYSPYLIFAMVSFLIILGVFAIFYEKIHALLAYFIAVNITTFLLYGYDKFISSGEKLRVPEYNLHALALLGGSPAGLLAQKFFRHKTLKSSFQLVYWLIVVVQMALLYWFR